MVLPGPGLLQRAVSWSVVLQQPDSESMSTAPVVTEGHVGGPVSDRPPGITSLSRNCDTPGVMAGAATWNRGDF